MRLSFHALICFIITTLPLRAFAQTDIETINAIPELEECHTDQFLQQQLDASPSFKERHEKMESKAHAFLKPGGNGMLKMDYILPIVVHIIHNNGPENVTDAEVIQSIEWLNDGFANINYYDQGVGVDTRIQFCLAKRDPDGNATSGINRVVSPLTDVTNDLAMKNLSRWDPTRYINIWLVKVAGGAGGYATLPGSHGSPTDGVVMLASKIKNVGSGHSTMIHELGHYLGLYHTWQGGCINNDCLADGDRVCDTPPDGSTAPPPTCFIPVNSCSTDTNSGLSSDMDDIIWNYVDYGNYACRAGYTQGQADRMAYFIENVRSSLLNTNACVDPCPNPFIVSFTPDQTTITMGETVNFLNTSTGGNNYEWQVNGVTFSNNTNAFYTFDTGAGEFEISLTATVPDPNCTEVFKQIITVNCPAEANFTPSVFETIPGGSIDFTNTSQNSNDFEWQINGVTIANTTDASYIFPALGNYTVNLLATDATGFCTDEYSFLIQVVCVSASFSADDLFPNPGSTVTFTNTSQGANSISWTINGMPQGSANEINYQFITQGVYTVCIEADNGNCNDNFCQDIYVFENSVLDCESTFIKKIGSENVDEWTTDLIPSGDGNFYIAGKNDDRSIILLIDPSGTIMDQRAFNFTNGDDFIASIMIDSDGFIVGSARDQWSSNTTNIIFKYDWQSDSFIWAKNISNPSYTRFEGSYENPSNGNYVFYGVVNPLGLDKYMVEFDNGNGNVIWQKQFDFGGNADFPLGHFFHGGSVYMTGAVRLGAALSDIRPYIGKFDYSGNIDWVNIYLRSPIQPSRINSTSILIENEKILSLGRGDLAGDNISDFVMFLFETEINGDINWAKQYSITGGNTVAGFQLATIPDGFIIRGNYVQNNGTNTLFFARLDKTGDVVWAKRVGTCSNDDRCRFTIADGFIVFSSYTNIYDNGNNNDLLFGRISLDGQVQAAGCDLIENIELVANDIPNAYEGNEQPTITSPNYSWNNEIINPLPVAMNIEDVPGCECQEFSVPCETTFISAYGTPTNESGRAMAVAPEGIIVGGNSNSGVHLSLINFDGSVLWDRSFDPTDQVETLTSLYLDSDGFLLGAGSTTTNNVGERQPFAFKYDYQNNIFIWVRVMDYFGLQQSGFTHVLENPNGGSYFIAGNFQNAPGGFGCDGMLAEIDRNTGALINISGYNLGSCESFSSAIIVNDKIYTSGRYNFAGGGTDFMRGAISELDFSGNEIWSRLYLVNINTNARLYTRQLIHENNAFYAIGHGDINGSSATDISTFFFKTGMDGQINWAKEFNIVGAGSEHGIRVFPVPDGFLLMGNFTQSGNRNIFLIKTDKNGNTLWSKAYGGNDDDEGHELLYLNGQIYIFGHTASFGNGSEDFLMMKLDLEGNILDDNCSFELPITIAENNFNNPYDGFHSLSRYSPQVTLNNPNPAIIDELYTENQLCFSPCIDTCANGAIRDSVPDVVLLLMDGKCNGQNISVSVQVCNDGEAVLPVGVPLSFYGENPTQLNTAVLATVLINDSLDAGECQVFEFDLPLPVNQQIYAVANDNGTTPRPFDLFTDFPNTAIEECDFTNNIGSFETMFNVPTLDLGSDVTVCHFGVTDLDAGPGFSSYNWSDNTFEQTTSVYQPGTYWVEVTDSCGGVQSDTIVIEVDPSTIVEIGVDSVDVCLGDSVTFSINGFTTYQWVPSDFLNCDTCSTATATPDTTITYILVAGSGEGCISEDTVTVTVLPLIATFDTLEFCPGDTVIIFGNEETTAGDYSSIYIGQNGCDSVHTISLVETTDTIVVNEQANLCVGDSLNYFGEWLNATGTYIHIDSTNSCYILNNLELSVHDTFSFLDTIYICEFDSALIFGNYESDEALYSNFDQTINGCDSSHYIYLSVFEQINTFDTATICQNDTAVIYGLPFTDPGTYENTYIDSNGCYSIHHINIKVNDIYLMEETTHICYGDSALIFGNYQTQAGSYTEIYQTADGCDSTVTINLGVGDEIILSTNTTAACPGAGEGAIGVDVVGGVWPFNYDWDFIGAPNDSILSNVQPGIYAVTVTDINGCSAIASDEVELLSEINISLEPSDELCDGSMDGTVVITVDIDSALFSIDGINFQTENIFSNLSAGTYTVTVLDAINNCSVEEEFVIQAPPPISVGLPADVTIELGDEISIQSNVSQDTLVYIWTPGIWLNCNDCPIVISQPEETILYTLNVFDENNCESADSILITVEFNPKVFIPNGFSPNDDGVNDVFFPNSKGVATIKLMRIFDRWGEMVYEGKEFLPNDPTNGWDGTFKGKPMDPAVFAYFVVVEYLDGREEMLEGDLTLIR